MSEVKDDVSSQKFVAGAGAGIASFAMLAFAGLAVRKYINGGNTKARKVNRRELLLAALGICGVSAVDYSVF